VPAAERASLSGAQWLQLHAALRGCAIHHPAARMRGRGR
jgi:hypothetical protein